MGKEKPTCPGCGMELAVGTIECPNCGMNLKTGETFEDKVKRAKQKRLHPSYLSRGVTLVPVVGFAIIVFGGFMFQRASENAMRQDSEQFTSFVQQLEEVESLVNAARKDEARAACENLIEELNKELSPSRIERWRRRRKGEPERREWTKKMLLFNLRRKAERYLKALGGAHPPEAAT